MATSQSGNNRRWLKREDWRTRRVSASTCGWRPVNVRLLPSNGLWTFMLCLTGYRLTILGIWLSKGEGGKHYLRKRTSNEQLMIKRAISVLRWISKRNWDLSGGGMVGSQQNAHVQIVRQHSRLVDAGEKFPRDVDRYRSLPLRRHCFQQKNGTTAIFYLSRWISSSRTVREKFKRQQFGGPRVEKFRTIFAPVRTFNFPLIVLFLRVRDTAYLFFASECTL